MRLNKEKLKGYLEKVKTTAGKVSRKIWILIAVAVILLVAGIIVFSNTRPYSTLITGATSEETASVMMWLDNQGFTDYKMEGTGTILVPETQVYNLKARLLQERYSSSSSPFSGYFERVSALSTEKDRENAWQAALTEEIRNTIRQFDGVRDASVTINFGEDRGYVLDTNNVVDASVGVILTMKNDVLLSDSQANAIRNYIAASIAGLNVESITIGDTWGNEYNSFGELGYSGTDTSALKLQLEQQWTNMVRTHIMQVLVPVYGQDNVSVAVNCVVEVGESTIEEYQVHLPDYALDGSTGGAGIIGTRFYSYTLLPTDEALAGGLVGTPTNSDLPQYVEQEPDDNEYGGRLEGSGSLEMDNSKTKTYTVRTAGYISDCTATVMINTTTAGVVDEDRVRRAVATAAGITPIATEDMTADQYLASKITVIGQAFYVEPGEEPEPVAPGGTGFEAIFGDLPLWVIIAAAGGLLLIIVLVVVILLVRRRKRKKKEEEMKQVEELLASVMPGEGAAEGAEGEAGGAGPEGADVMDLDTERSMELRQSIREFVDENMEVAALLVKSWLKEDDENA